MSITALSREIIDYPFGEYGRLAGVGDRVRVMCLPEFENVEGKIVAADDQSLSLMICAGYTIVIDVGDIEILEIIMKRQILT